MSLDEKVKEKDHSQGVDADVLVRTLARIISRSEKNPVTRAGLRLNYQKNLKDLGQAPGMHLLMAMRITYSGPQTFEKGIHLGACMAMSAILDPAQLQLMHDALVAEQDGEKKVKQEEDKNG